MGIPETRMPSVAHASRTDRNRNRRRPPCQNPVRSPLTGCGFADSVGRLGCGESASKYLDAVCQVAHDVRPCRTWRQMVALRQLSRGCVDDTLFVRSENRSKLALGFLHICLSFRTPAHDCKVGVDSRSDFDTSRHQIANVYEIFSGLWIASRYSVIDDGTPPNERRRFRSDVGAKRGD